MKKSLSLVLIVSTLASCWYVFSYLAVSDPSIKTAEERSAKRLKNSLITHKNCNSCHTPEGEDFIVTNGVLAGQGFLYLKKQLTDLSAGVRTIKNINPVNHRLSAEDIIKQADIYAIQKRYVNVSEGSEAGKLLYHNGDDNRLIPACMACHVKNGYGIPTATLPALSGQTPEYIINQLKSFRNGSRKNDVDHMMQKIAVRLSDEDISALALYISTLN